MRKRYHFLLVIYLLMWSGAAGQVSLSDYLSVVVSFTESGQNLEAVKICDRLSSQYPENADVYFLRGINHYVLEDYKRAIDDFGRTAELDPDYPDVYLYRARAKKADKDYLGALRDYNRAKDQNFSTTLTSLAGDMLKSVFSGRDE